MDGCTEASPGTCRVKAGEWGCVARAQQVSACRRAGYRGDRGVPGPRFQFIKGDLLRA